MKRRQFLKQLPFFPLTLGMAAKAQPTKKSPAVLLNQFSIAGFQYYEGPRLLAFLKPGMAVRLIAQPNHPEDPFAVAIYWKRFQLGYVPRSDNKHISRMLQQGIALQARIWQVNPEEPSWHQVKVKIWLES